LHQTPEIRVVPDEVLMDEVTVNRGPGGNRERLCGTVVPMPDAVLTGDVRHQVVCERVTRGFYEQSHMLVARGLTVGERKRVFSVSDKLQLPGPTGDPGRCCARNAQQCKRCAVMNYSFHGFSPSQSQSPHLPWWGR